MLSGRTLVIATRHEKEKVLAPLFEEAWGVKCIIPPELNTDQFGTFSGEVIREGTALDAARRKCIEAARLTGETLVLASEGSFGPDPSVPFAVCNVELLLLVDLTLRREFVAHEITMETNFNAAHVSSWVALRDFAERVGFPAHALIVRAGKENYALQQKGLQDWGTLEQAFHSIVKTSGQVYVETDMRAHFNPTRMKAIRRAGRKLIDNMNSRCPRCEAPGYTISSVMRGLPCEDCGEPTKGVLAHISTCGQCHFESAHWYPLGVKNENAMYCDRCNP